MSGGPAGETRCWPCAVANSTVGLVVAWLPLAAALVRGSPELVAITAIWGLLVTWYTGYRLLDRGYLPGAERVARLTGLHDRIGPGSGARPDHRRENE